MRKRLTTALLIISALLSVGAALAPVARAESSPSAYASRLVALINSARANQGLHTLTVTGGTSTVAANWTQHLAQQQGLSHNPNLGPQLESHGSRDWTAYGENVGAAPTSSAQALFDAYMRSPEHRANILKPAYRYLGVGVVFTGSTAWNTLDFVDEYSGGSTTPSTVTVHHSTATAPVSTVHHTTKSHVAAAVPATRATVVRHPHVTVVPRRKVQVEAVTAVLPAIAPAAPVMPAVDTVRAAATAPVRVPSPGRSPLPFALAVFTLVVAASRFLLAVRPRSV